MTQPVLCIYRADDEDTLLAVWAVRRALPDTEFVAARKGDDPPIPDIIMYHVAVGVARDILILGDLYPLPTLRAMAREARSVLVLAGGEEAQKGLNELHPPSDGRRRITDFFGWLYWLNTIYTMPVTGTIAAITVPSRSVCGIAWDYLHPDKARPHIIDLIGDYTLGERVSPKGGIDSSDEFAFGDETRAFVAVLRSYDWTDLPAMLERLTSWQSWYRHRDDHDYWNNLLAEGHAILRAERQRLARADECHSLTARERAEAFSRRITRPRVPPEFIDALTAEFERARQDSDDFAAQRVAMTDEPSAEANRIVQRIRRRINGGNDWDLNYTEAARALDNFAAQRVAEEREGYLTLVNSAYQLLRTLGYNHEAPDGDAPVDRDVNPDFPTTDVAAKRVLAALRRKEP